MSWNQVGHKELQKNCKNDRPIKRLPLDRNDREGRVGPQIGLYNEQDSKKEANNTVIWL